MIVRPVVYKWHINEQGLHLNDMGSCEVSGALPLEGAAPRKPVSSHSRMAFRVHEVCVRSDEEAEGQDILSYYPIPDNAAQKQTEASPRFLPSEPFLILQLCTVHKGFQIPICNSACKSKRGDWVRPSWVKYFLTV